MEPQTATLNKCDECGFQWKSAIINPKKCPHCQQPLKDWKPVTQHCKACGYRWEIRTRSPKKCPRCGRWLEEWKPLDER